MLDNNTLYVVQIQALAWVSALCSGASTHKWVPTNLLLEESALKGEIKGEWKSPSRLILLEPGYAPRLIGH